MKGLFVVRLWEIIGESIKVKVPQDGLIKFRSDPPGFSILTVVLAGVLR